MKTLLACAAALAMLATVPAEAGDRGYHRHYHKHYQKPPKTTPVTAPRLSIGCGKAYAVGSNCYDPMAAFRAPEVLSEPLRLMAPGGDGINLDGVTDATTLSVIDGRAVLR